MAAQGLSEDAAFELVEELEGIPNARTLRFRENAPFRPAYVVMARTLVELCHGYGTISPWEQARTIINNALHWDSWRGPTGLVGEYESRFPRYKPQHLHTGVAAGAGLPVQSCANGAAARLSGRLQQHAEKQSSGKGLSEDAAFELVEELEGIPNARISRLRENAPLRPAYVVMARTLVELCHGYGTISAWEQARAVINKALLWDDWRGPTGLVAEYESRFPRHKPERLQAGMAAGAATVQNCENDAPSRLIDHLQGQAETQPRLFPDFPDRPPQTMRPRHRPSRRPSTR